MTTTETETRELTYLGAFNEGLRQVMAEDDSVFVAGEDVGKAGGVFGHFAGLAEEFGDRRCFDTPIAEQAIVGLGTGAAVNGSPAGDAAGGANEGGAAGAVAVGVDPGAAQGEPSAAGGASDGAGGDTGGLESAMGPMVRTDRFTRR